jgi:hypothetical protein
MLIFEIFSQMGCAAVYISYVYITSRIGIFKIKTAAFNLTFYCPCNELIPSSTAAASFTDFR